MPINGIVYKGELAVTPEVYYQIYNSGEQSGSFLL